ncbi:MAG TPA: hypothetical protein VGG85_11260 [Terracidiphilus sp.]|jgi:hypothetical protein
MHFHFPFNAQDILWTLAFAAHLVLLVVLMGRDRISRFPWFTASIVMVALRLVSMKLLNGRLPQMTAAAVFITMGDIGALLGVLVVLEMARKTFRGVKRSTWMTGALVLMAIGAAVLRYWGPWPPLKTMLSSSTMSVLQLMQLLVQKTSLLVDVETILVGLLIFLFGRRFNAGWRSHTQQIVIGLSTASVAQLSIQGVWETITHTATARTMQEYQHIMGLREKLFNTNSVVYLVVVIWWIVCLWNDEPGAAKDADQAASQKTMLGAAEEPASLESATFDLDRVDPELIEPHGVENPGGGEPKADRA